MKQTLGRTVLSAILLCALPMVGVGLAGNPLKPYLEFPPLTVYVTHAPFCWMALILVILLVAGSCLPFLLRLIRFRPPDHGRPTSFRRFPWWGIMGVLVVIAAWVLAWNRFPWFEPLQAYTFLPLWLGYILAVNGLACHRAGHCLMLDNRRHFLNLFPLSAAFWWFFEYLNRFVQNWYYAGVETFSAGEYFLHASLSFSTVLPAVMSTAAYLATFPRLTMPLASAWKLRLPNAALPGWAICVPAVIGLAGIGVWPDYLFPLLWLSPLLIITGIQAIHGQATILSRLRQGDWRPVWLPALAALICGFFWEMWNFKSLAHWEYSVPFVQRFQIFAMPLAGYAGYLPFGLECALVAGLLRKAGSPR